MDVHMQLLVIVNTSAYLGPFIVVLRSMKYRPAVILHDMVPQTIGQTAKWCIRQKTTLSSIKRESKGHDVWQSPVSFFFINVVRCQPMELSPNSFQSLEGVLNVIAVCFKHKIEECFSVEALWRADY